MGQRLGFIGAGNMAEAIAKAAMAGGVLRASEMIAADPAEARRAVFAKMGIEIAADNAAVIARADQIMLAVKPQTLAALGKDLATIDCAKQVVISIMAGVSTGKISLTAGKALRVIRVMPNTPLQIGVGMAGVCRGEHAREGDDALALKLFGSGKSQAICVDESLMDAVTAVSGSGPAYVYYLAEAMEQAAAALGLGEHGNLLSRQTVLGAAMLLSQSDLPAAELRRRVTSPGGTTEAAIKHMEANKLTQIVVNAIGAAERRGKELGR